MLYANVPAESPSYVPTFFILFYRKHKRVYIFLRSKLRCFYGRPERSCVWNWNRPCSGCEESHTRGELVVQRGSKGCILSVMCTGTQVISDIHSRGPDAAVPKSTLWTKIRPTTFCINDESSSLWNKNSWHKANMFKCIRKGNYFNSRISKLNRYTKYHSRGSNPSICARKRATNIPDQVSYEFRKWLVCPIKVWEEEIRIRSIGRETKSNVIEHRYNNRDGYVKGRLCSTITATYWHEILTKS